MAALLIREGFIALEDLYPHVGLLHSYASLAFMGIVGFPVR